MKARALLIAALLLSALSTVGCFDPIVGVECAQGYVPCNGHCVARCTVDGAAAGDARDGSAIDGVGISQDVGQDPTHGDGGMLFDGGLTTGDGARPTDGGTGDAIRDDVRRDDAPASGDASSVEVASNDAAPVNDVSLGDTSVSDSAASDATATDASATDVPTTDASITDASITDALTTDAAPPTDGPPPIDCGTQTLCPIGCVNLLDDPDNCGSCGFSCGSGLCINGICQQRQAGHLVVIGHDYTVSRNSMDNIVGNAVFLAPGTSVNVMAYHGAATAAEIAGTDSAIQKVATNTGRTWRKTVVPAQDVQSGLAFADVFIIYAQAGATDTTLLALGSNWATALSDFVQAGKTIVVLEGWYGNGGTYQIVQQANLFHATGRLEVTGQTMVVARPGDAIATRVPQSYRGERGTVWFATTDQTVVVQVATDAGTQPVVVHVVY